jgi:broad specificity phosphatase PhoE
MDKQIGIWKEKYNENCDDVAIITHSAVIMCLQCYLTNTPFNEMMKFKTDNTRVQPTYMYVGCTRIGT